MASLTFGYQGYSIEFDPEPVADGYRPRAVIVGAGGPNRRSRLTVPMEAVVFPTAREAAQYGILAGVSWIDRSLRVGRAAPVPAPPSPDPAAVRVPRADGRFAPASGGRTRRTTDED